MVLNSLLEVQNLESKSNFRFAGRGEVRGDSQHGQEDLPDGARRGRAAAARGQGRWRLEADRPERIMPFRCFDHNQDLEDLGFHLQLPAETMHKLQSSTKRICSHRSSCCGMQGLESLSNEHRPEFFREFKVVKKLAADFDKKHPPPDPNEAAAASPARKKRKGAARDEGKDEAGGGGGAEKEPETKPAAKRARRGPKKEEEAGEAGEDATEEVDDAAQRGVTKVHSKCT